LHWLIAPFNEELAYRVGLFGASKRLNIYFAYFMASIVFGFIHMHFISAGWDNINEWLSLPDYVLAGLIFAYVYDHFGFGASFMAHATNNLVAVLATIINLAINNR
jgi:membrane protease YdiL (CAAX protease family)